MTKNAFLDKQFELSVCAGMNQRYHQKRAHKWALLDRIFKIIVAGLAIVAVCLSIVAAMAESKVWDGFAIAVAILAAIFAIVLNVLPFGEWTSLHHALFQRWTDFREDVDSMPFSLGADVTAENIEHLKTLDAKVHRICASEPKADDSLLLKCCREEAKSRERRQPSEGGLPGSANQCQIGQPAIA